MNPFLSSSMCARILILFSFFAYDYLIQTCTFQTTYWLVITSFSICSNFKLNFLETQELMECSLLMSSNWFDLSNVRKHSLKIISIRSNDFAQVTTTSLYRLTSPRGRECVNCKHFSIWLLLPNSLIEECWIEKSDEKSRERTFKCGYSTIFSILKRTF